MKADDEPEGFYNKGLPPSPQYLAKDVAYVTLVDEPVDENCRMFSTGTVDGVRTESVAVQRPSVPDTRSHYEVLGISRTEDYRDILRAMKKLRSSGELTAKQQNAFNTLLDFGARIKYNAVLDANGSQCPTCHGGGTTFFRPGDDFQKRDSSYGATVDLEATVGTLHSKICATCRGNGAV